MLTAEGVWPDCRLETNAFCWARQSGYDGRQQATGMEFSVATAVNNKAVHFYVLVWSVQTVVLCRVGPGCNVAVPLDRVAICIHAGGLDTVFKFKHN